MHKTMQLILLMVLAGATAKAKAPNILIMMSDDQSFPHASAYGSKMVAKTKSRFRAERE